MSLKATGVAGALGTAKIARENAGELDSPTSRERTLGHTVCRLLVYNMKCMHRYLIQKGLFTQSHHHAYMYVYLFGPGDGTNMLQSSRGARHV